MNSRDYLSLIKKLDAVLSIQQGQLREARDNSYCITPHLDGMPHDHNISDKVAEGVIKADTIEGHIEHTLMVKEALKSEITGEIEKLEPYSREALYRYYMLGERNEELSSGMDYPISSVYAWRFQGLCNLQVIESPTLKEAINIINQYNRRKVLI